jgi:hypothetical protein
MSRWNDITINLKEMGFMWHRIRNRGELMSRANEM